MDVITQIFVLFFGVGAVFLVGLKTDKKRWGYILGICGQPFWFYQFITHEQYWLIGIGILYTISWINGIRNYWCKK